jgi:hypothetical protein
MTSFFSIFSSVSVIVVFVYVSFDPFGLNVGSPRIVVFVDVTSRLKVSSSRRRDEPGVDSDAFESASSEALEGDDDKILSTIALGDGDDVNRVVVVFDGEPVRDVVVVVVVDDVTFFSGDRSRFGVDDNPSMLMVFSRSGLRIGTVASPFKRVKNNYDFNLFSHPKCMYNNHF